MITQVFVACSYDHGRRDLRTRLLLKRLTLNVVIANMFSVPLGIMFGADVRDQVFGLEFSSDVYLFKITPAEYIRK